MLVNPAGTLPESRLLAVYLHKEENQAVREVAEKEREVEHFNLPNATDDRVIRLPNSVGIVPVSMFLAVYEV